MKPFNAWAIVNKHGVICANRYEIFKSLPMAQYFTEVLDHYYSEEKNIVYVEIREVKQTKKGK